MLSTAFAAGVASITRAATCLWNSDKDPANGATEGCGCWTSGIATFFNPITGLETAAGSGDIAQFGNGGLLASGSTVTVGTQTIGGLVLGMTGNSGYTLDNTSSSTITIGAGGSAMNTAGPSQVTINAPLVLGAAQTRAVADAGATLNVQGGNPANAWISGSGSIDKTGAGVLVLGGFNNFTGGVTVDGGMLDINNGGSLSSNSGLGTVAITIAGGTTIGTNVALLVVPEPNSWSMLVGSLGTALGLQRFRRRKSS